MRGPVSGRAEESSRPARQIGRRFDGYDGAALLLLLLLAAAVVLTVGDYAISNDEEVQHRYGELIIAYYASGFSDDTLFHYKNLYLYGGLFDIVSVLLSRALPIDTFLIRHFLSACAGLAGIAATWATARLVGGSRAGLLAAALLTTSAYWYGGMFNHTKDVPFAAAMMGTLYFLLCAARALPHPQLRHVLGFGLVLGMALGLRATGLLVIGYAGLLVLARAAELAQASLQARAGFVLEAALRLLPAFVLAYGLMIAAWPWASLAPFNPVRAIFAFAHFHYPIGTFASGAFFDMATVPRWYVPLYLSIKLPLLLLVGAALGVATALQTTWLRSRDPRRAELGLLMFAIAFPVLIQVAVRGPAFTGMRHFLFVVPPLAVLAGYGLDALLTLASKQRLVAVATAGVLVAALCWDAGMLVRLHPHPYVFFNPLVGGLEGATRRYDTDYWVNIMPEGVSILRGFLARTERSARRRFTVAVCAERLSFEHEADPRMEWTDDWKRADFFIAPTHGNCDRVLRGPTIGHIERLGVELGVVKDLRGRTAEQRGFAPEIARSR